MTNIVHVAGSGRCGTTVLNKILGQHSDIIVTPPWRFMIDPDGVIDFMKTSQICWSPYHIDIRLKRMRAILKDVSKPVLPISILEKMGLRQWARKLGVGLLPRYPHLNANEFCFCFDEVAEELLINCTDFDYKANWVGTRFFEKHEMKYTAMDNDVVNHCREFYQKIVNSVCIQNNVSVLIDRNTWNHLWLDQFLKLDPSIKLLHIHRHPLDVISSFMAQNWMPNTAVEASKIYMGIMNRWWQVEKLVPPESFIDISLEHMVENTSDELNRICNFIELPFDAKMFEVSLSKANTHRWKKDISKDCLCQIMPIIEPALSRYNYAVE